MEKLYYIEECHKRFIFKLIETENKKFSIVKLCISLKKRNDFTEV